MAALILAYGSTGLGIGSYLILLALLAAVHDVVPEVLVEERRFLYHRTRPQYRVFRSVLSGSYAIVAYARS
eukprot:1258255-Rhodomonas_salina.1